MSVFISIGCILAISIVNFISQTGYAALEKTTPSRESILPAPQVHFKSELGFEINAAQTGWELIESPVGSPYIQALFRSNRPTVNEKDSRASLTLRLDRLDSPLPLKQYVKRWEKEYPRYGFKVLGSGSFKQNSSTGFYLDLYNRENNKKLRQAIFIKDTNAVILTCRDENSRFKESLKACNDIIRTFKW